MSKAVRHKLASGEWRVADVPDDWQDGDPYPEPMPTDKYSQTEDEARNEWLSRVVPQPVDDDSN